MPLYQAHGKTFLFVHIPKAAGTTIEFGLESWRIGLLDRTFNGAFFCCSPQHFHGEILTKLLDVERLALSFAVVRNPLDRFVSEFKFRRKFFGLKEEIDSWGIKILDDYQKNPFILDNHIRPQSEFLLPTTSVFRIEDGMEKIEMHLSEHLGIDVRFHGSREMVSGSGEMPLLNKVLLDRLMEFYQCDYERFRYEIEGSEALYNRG